jgi:hypothetical protein
MSPFKTHRSPLLCLLILSSFFSALYSQENTVPASDTERLKLNVHVSGFTDIPFLADKIEFAHFVSEKDLALVAIKIEEKPTISGGKEFIITYSGCKELTGLSDELSYVPQPRETEENIKQALAKIMETALIKYAARTPVAENISIEYSHTEEQVAAVKDKWNYWLFSLNFYFGLSGEKSMKGSSLSGGLSARRITDEWIMRASVYTNYNENTYDMEEIGLSYKNITRDHNFNGLLVKSISDHWSVGAFLEASQETYYNNQFSFELAPAVEYNIFPYIESEKRSFTFLYKLGYIYRKYWEETIYRKTREGLVQTSLMADVEVFKRWGSIESSLSGSVYLKDFSKNRLTWDFEIGIRLFKRLTFDIEWRVSMIHDQIFLERGGASLEEVLLRRKRLETLYDYSIEFGFSYSFGSLISDVVNPIFGN